jgi:FXSXX-COOH protein
VWQHIAASNSGWKPLGSGYNWRGPAVVRGGGMANLTDADLDSHLVDLTEVPLAELRDMRTSALVAALQNLYEAAAYNTGNELQGQNLDSGG